MNRNRLLDISTNETNYETTETNNETKGVDQTKGLSYKDSDMVNSGDAKAQCRKWSPKKRVESDSKYNKEYSIQLVNKKKLVGEINKIVPKYLVKISKGRLKKMKIKIVARQVSKKSFPVTQKKHMGGR